MTRLATQVPEAMAGMRLDQVLAELFADYSRSKLQTWVKAGRVKVNGQTLKSRDKLDGGEVIELDSEAEIVIDCTPENIALDIVFEDEAVLIVNKPAGLVVHPAAGNWSGTLQNALLSHHPDLAALPRAGIVHRLDKDTSGLLMVAKTLQAHNSLVTQLQERSVHREYLAITKGRIIAGGTVDEPIGRHPSDRKRFAVRSAGKPAV
ncbi:MAG: RNA pseudouridine synthase, partial [Gammaproteobacteria bacterium HGW-Gammaproteobacteria-10]